MNRDAIQQNRDPIGYTKRTRRYPAPSGNQVVTPKLVNIPQRPQSNSANQFPRIESGSDATPEQIAEDLMLENLMRIESQVNLLRFVIFSNFTKQP